ncbi:DUF6457 domain-containing protein [Cellulomonas massiliensis]|uniref:DUF6457 domain-containing protein n=1 Tax=Cellulomonas massiliensis TaxID=1465811 RepID=UPI0002EC84E6|nr:DUF6457 domain-containing protein [Cellulomonas massiliensis]
MSADHLPPEALDDWLAGVSGLFGLAGVTTDETAVVLDVARDVARGVARPAAPLTAYLLGLAAGRASAAGEPVAAATARLAGELRALLAPDAPASDG